MIRFYYASGSPFSWRVQLALEEKGIPYEAVLLRFDRGELKTPEYLARSPHGKVPALDDGAVSLYESAAILEYLEEKFPKPPLLPAEPAARALVRIEELEATDYFIGQFRPVARELFFTPAERRDAAALAAGQAATYAELDRLEARVAARGGPWIAGDGFTRADTTWLPFVEIAGRAKVDLDAARTPRLVAWRERMRARPGYARSYPPLWK